MPENVNVTLEEALTNLQNLAENVQGNWKTHLILQASLQTIKDALAAHPGSVAG